MTGDRTLHLPSGLRAGSVPGCFGHGILASETTRLGSRSGPGGESGQAEAGRECGADTVHAS